MTTVLINCILLRHSSGFQNFWILHCRTSPQTYRQQQYRDLIVRHMHAPVQWVRSLFGCTHLLRRSVASLDATITLTPAYYAYYQTINTCSVIVIGLSLPSSSRSHVTDVMVNSCSNVQIYAIRPTQLSYKPDTATVSTHTYRVWCIRTDNPWILSLTNHT